MKINFNILCSWLIKEFPNDQELGKEIRKYYLSLKG
jgi:hypothetical protein